MHAQSLGSSLAPDVQALMVARESLTRQEAHEALDNERFGALKEGMQEQTKTSRAIMEELGKARNDTNESLRRIHGRIEESAREQNLARHNANDKLAGVIAEVNLNVLSLKEDLAKKVEDSIGRVDSKVEVIKDEVTRYKHFLLWRAVIVLAFLLVAVVSAGWWGFTTYIAPQPVQIQRSIDLAD